MNWISVNEKLPPTDHLVIVTVKDGRAYYASSGELYNMSQGEWRVLQALGTYEDTIYTKNVTHWMEFPAPAYP